MTRILNELENALAKEQFQQAWGILRHAILEPFNVLDMQKCSQLLVRHAQAWKGFIHHRQIRIALLGGYTTQPIKTLLLPLLLSEGYWPEIYEGNYHSFLTEPLDPASPLFAFAPDLILIATGNRHITQWPQVDATEEQVRIYAERVAEEWRQRWQAIRRHSAARIIQHNFELPTDTFFGRLENRLPGSRSRFVQHLNDLFWAHEGREIRVLDAWQISAEVGGWNWFDARWFHHGKLGFAPTMLYHYGRALGGGVRALLGTTRKCLVTDLDNTLWGGQVGDAGIEGIELGNSSGNGEAFADFCHWLKNMAQTGILLAINSKNDPDLVSEVFQRHPEMPLKRADIACMVCNWEPKSKNLRLIARELNLGLESLVFIDDNPAECAEVRRNEPGVVVLETKGDPAHFPRQVQALHLFDRLDLTNEDLGRSQSYQAQHLIQESSAHPARLDEFLSGLEMKAEIRPAQANDLPRVEQLFAKTNQFNLTGRKYAHDSLAVDLAAQRCHCWICKLEDNLASHGLVSSWVATVEADCLVVDNWVMSCRVFTRTLEYAIVAQLLAFAKAQGISRIRFHLIETPKNKYAQEMFKKLGWRQDGGGTSWIYEIAVHTTSAPETYITLVGS